MAFEDEKFGTLFPVRTGVPTGGANERQMLSSTGGAAGYRKRFQTNLDGSVTMLQTKNGMPEFSRTRVTAAAIGIVDSKTYMSSGGYYLGPLGGYNMLSPELTTDTEVFKSSQLNSLEALVLTPLYKKQPPVAGGVSNIYSRQSMSPETLTAEKASLFYKNPSEFSGLMRWLVQGRYGVGKTDLMLGDDSGYIMFGSDYNRTSGVLKFGDRYFMVIIASNGSAAVSVKGYPLTIPAKYIRLLGEVSGDAAKAREVLALSFATASVEGEIYLGAFTVPYGDPLYYGWNFSLTTNVADIVISYNPGNNYDRKIWSHLRMTFTYAAGLSCALEVVEQVDGTMISARSPIWVPTESVTLWNNKYKTSPDPSGPQDIPIYAFYVDDALKMLRWSWAATTEGPEGGAILKAEAQINAPHIFGVGSTGYVVRYNYGTVGTHGFYIAGVSSPISSGTSYTSFSESITSDWGLCIDSGENGPPSAPPPVLSGDAEFAFRSAFDRFDGSEFSSYNPYAYPEGLALGAAPPDPRPEGHYAWYGRTNAIRTHRTESRTGTSNHITCAVIPATDCSSIYIGQKVSRSGDATIVERVYEGLARIDEWELDPDPDPEVNAVVVGTWFEPVTRQMGVDPELPGLGVPLGVELSSEDPFTEILPTITMFRKEAEIVGTSDSDVFHPTVGYPMLTTLVKSISSGVLLDCRYNVGALTGSEMAATNNYPVTTQLFIGTA